MKWLLGDHHVCYLQGENKYTLMHMPKKNLVLELAERAVYMGMSDAQIGQQ